MPCSRCECISLFSSRFFTEGLGRRCPTAWLRNLAGRWDSPFQTWPLSLRHSQVHPATWGGAGQARLGHLGLLQHCHHTTTKHCCVTEVLEVTTEGSQSILIGQEKIYFISNMGGFLLGIIFCERVKQASRTSHFCDLKRNFAPLPLNYKQALGLCHPW